MGGTTVLLTYDDWNPILKWDGAVNWKAWTIYDAKPNEVLCRYDINHGPLMYKQDNQEISFPLGRW